MKAEYDVAVIGGGPGGYVAAIRAARMGLKVTLIEEHELGGTCLNRGCIPTKSLLHSAEVYQTVINCASYGVGTNTVSFDYAKMAQKKNSAVKQLRAGVVSLVKDSGADIIRGRAIISESHIIKVIGQDAGTVSADKIIIATGSRPTKPPIPGIDGNNVIGSDEVLSLDACPERTVIIGGGVIGVEFATLFSSLGMKVTIVEMMDSILAGMDIEISAMTRKVLEKNGVGIYTGARVKEIKSSDVVVCCFESGGKEYLLEGDVAIVAAGRRPNSENLGLENIGVETDRGFIKVNNRMETSVKGIYAIGDVTGKGLLAHVASAQGLVAAANAAGKSSIMDYGIVPSCIYTQPEIAAVGLTEDEAVKKGHRVRIGKFPIAANGKSLIMGEREGLVKIITDADTGEILGAHVMGPRATDIIGEICVAMKLESTVEELASVIHPHPTVSEILMEAAHDVEGMCVHKPI